MTFLRRPLRPLRPVPLAFVTLLALLSVVALACHSGDSSTTGRRVVEVSIEDGQLVLSDAIRFETDSDTLAAGSTDALDAIADFLQSHSGITGVRVEGHSDEHGSDEHNLDLSRRRARTVADYLVARGVTLSIETSGLGATHPACAETTEACDARNRRVDFFVDSE